MNLIRQLLDVGIFIVRFDRTCKKGCTADKSRLFLLRVKLTSRLNESKLPVRGIFIGATVQRGHDWKWANQDGGEGMFISIITYINPRFIYMI